MTEKRPVTRRGFLETAGIAAGSAAIAPSAFAHPAIGNVKGANEKLNFAIIGPGGRAQAHIDNLLNFKKEGKLVDIIGVADVWDGNKSVGRGLYPSADKCGLKHDDNLVTKDYRTSSGASGPAIRKPCARRTSVMRPSRPSTWASTPTAKARPTSSMARPARPPRPTRPGPRSGKRLARNAGSPLR